MVNQNNILDILKTSPSVALLKARSSGIIIDFLTRVYGDVAAVSHENIHSLLAEYLNSHGFDSSLRLSIGFLKRINRKEVATVLAS